MITADENRREKFETRLRALQRGIQAMEAAKWLATYSHMPDENNPNTGVPTPKIFHCRIHYGSANKDDKAAESYFQTAFERFVPQIMERMRELIAQDIQDAE